MMKFRNYGIGFIFFIIYLINQCYCIGLNNGKFWHITDSHFDFSYGTSCTSKKGVSPIGSYHCDSSYELLISSFEYMNKMEPNPDFIIYTGDDPPHFSNSQLNQSIILQSISNVTNLITQYFPKTRVFPCLGNHDSYPQHQIGVGPNNWLYDGAADIWSQFLSDQALETFKIGGYYSELVEPGFRIISLNTNLYYTQNKQCINMTDPAGQLAWLNSTLANSSYDGEKVWIIGHVPPGYNEKYDIFNFHKQFNDEYLFSFGQYSDIIQFHIYGHEHTDSFRLYYGDIDKLGSVPDGIMFLSPSVTPWSNKYLPTLPNNPGLRIYQYNITDFSLLDYYQYWTNLTADIENNSIEWSLEYKATEFFKVAKLDPISMYEAFLLIVNVPEQLEQYYFYNSVSYPTKGCDAVCRKIQLCSIGCPFEKSFAKCLLEM